MNREHRTDNLKGLRERVLKPFKRAEKVFRRKLGDYKNAETKHTPPPLVVRPVEWLGLGGNSPRYSAKVFDSDGVFYAEIISFEEQTTNERARLIAAAPTLLTALKNARDDHQRVNPHHHDLCDLCLDMDAAIAAAEAL